MIELSIVIFLISLIVFVSLFNRRKLRKKRREKAQRGITQLSDILNLIQCLQRHRGVCANLDGSNQTEQRRLSNEINQLWQPLLDSSYGGNVKRVNLQHKNWKTIEAQPSSSFMAHCELIERLLHELTVIADTCSLTASNNGHDSEELWQNLLRRPHFAESLARLRGLGNKAANMGHCPAAVRVQLQYLLMNMREDALCDSTIREVDALVTEEILEPEKIQIEPRVYFSRLTQAIDQQIQMTRDHLQQLS